jgi:hypothetical protein
MDKLSHLLAATSSGTVSVNADVICALSYDQIIPGSLPIIDG